MGFFKRRKQEEFNKEKTLKYLQMLYSTPYGYRLRQYCRNIVNKEECSMVPEFEVILSNCSRSTGLSKNSVATLLLELMDEAAQNLD